jgi:small GTP-binding protein
MSKRTDSDSEEEPEQLQFKVTQCNELCVAQAKAVLLNLTQYALQCATVHAATLQIILLGDGAVGKSSIATRFSQEAFNQTYKQTIGLDFFIKRIVLENGTNIAMQLWDIGGQSLGSKMISNYIHGAHAVLLCYDITNSESFQNLEDWHMVVRRACSSNDDNDSGPTMPFMALVGNKCDLSHMRAVRTERAHAFADEVRAHEWTLRICYIAAALY